MATGSEAVERFLGGNACSQAVICHYCKSFDLDRISALKIASGFGAGMQMAGTCGAVTAAYMILGLKFGNDECGKPEGRKKVTAAVKLFTKEFKRRNGTTDCRDLLRCDISTADGMQTAKEQELFKNVCPGFVGDAVELLKEIIEQE